MNLSKVTWIVEQDVFLKNEKAIKEAVNKYGMEYYPYVDCDIKDSIGKVMEDTNSEDCIISYACLDTISKLQRALGCVPTSYANFNNFKCSTYYPHYKDYLLADNYAFYPWGSLDDQKDNIFHNFGRNYGEDIFIRPDSGMKTFTGKVLERESCKNGITDALKSWVYNDIAPDELILVAEPTKILNEYRFIAGGGEVISGSRYMTIDNEGNLVHDEDSQYSMKAWDVAREIAREKWQPDRIFAIDIAEIECYDGPHYKLIEINAFSTCDWYLGNIEKIVKKASEIALEEWKEYY
jgi:hypothetical protein